MDMRREERVPARIAALVTSILPDGDLLVQRAATVDISGDGGCVEGLGEPLLIGSTVAVQNGDKRARFRVVWVGEQGTERDGQFGLQRLSGATDKHSILYIDDDLAGAELRRRNLAELGFNITHAASSAEGFERLRDGRYTLVMVTYPMRDMETTDLIVAIRRSGKKARIMLLSSFSSIPEPLLELVDAPVRKSEPLQAVVSAIEWALEDHKHIKFPTRSYRRFAVQVPVAVEVLRSGERMMYYGTSIDLSERGVGAKVHALLVPGEMTKVYFSLPNSSMEIEAHAMVRHRGGNNFYGLEFIAITPAAVDTVRALCAVLPSISLAK
jgi:CheY-like chemotaxis protein